MLSQTQPNPFCHRLLDFDGRSTWNEGVDYGAGGKEHWFTDEDRPALERLLSSLRTIGKKEALHLIAHDIDFSFVQLPGNASAATTSSEETEQHHALMHDLVTHYTCFCHDQRLAGVH